MFIQTKLSVNQAEIFGYGGEEWAAMKPNKIFAFSLTS